MTLDQRLTYTLSLRRQGYNCAQSVLMAFSDFTGLNPDTAAAVSSALGTGVAASGNICGVPNAIAMVIGTLHGADPAAKVAATAEAKPLIEEFQRLNDNRIQCRDLKGKVGIRPCNDLVLLGVEILHKHLSSKQPQP
ncbi:MAG: C-GCAxxG-C-C family protein [Muribaculum sp.]|nr:C-GCAxxG-C-C family protein [Muribaculum sp.]